MAGCAPPAGGCCRCHRSDPPCARAPLARSPRGRPTARARALRATATITARIHPTATARSRSRPTATATEIYAVICPVPSRRVHRQTTPWLPHRPPQAKKKNGTKIVGNSPLLLTTIRLPARALVLPLPLRPSLDLPLPLRPHAILPLPPNPSWGVGAARERDANRAPHCSSAPHGEP